MSKRFPWGRIIKTHIVGPYEIVEYAERGADNHETHPRQETGKVLFHVSNEPGGHSGKSWESLEKALIGAIDMRLNHDCARAAYYAFKVLELP